MMNYPLLVLNIDSAETYLRHFRDMTVSVKTLYQALTHIRG